MNAPILLSSAANRQIIRNATLGELRQFRLSEDLYGEGGALLGRAGESVMLSVMPSDTGDQLRVIDNYISGYKNFGFVGDVISPVVLVDHEAGNRIDRSMNSAFLLTDTNVGRQGSINEIQDLNTRTPYKTQEHALAAFIPWASENDAVQQYNVRTAHSEMLADLLLLRREYDLLNITNGLLTTLTNWNSNNRSSITTNFKWDNGSTKNPRADIQTAMKASAQKVTGLMMNPDVLFYLLSDTEFRAYLKASMGNDAPVPDMAYQVDAVNKGLQVIHLYGYPPIYVAGAQYQATSGAALSYVMGDDVVLFSHPPNNVPINMFSNATSLTFRVKGKSGNGWVTNEYLPNGRGLNGGRMLETGFGETAFLGSNRAGYLLKDVLST
jgi:hypothetical protein